MLHLMRPFCLTLMILGIGCFASVDSAVAAVFRDRATFIAASQNLRNIDFENAPNFHRDFQIDGILFQNIAGPPHIVQWPSLPTKILRGHSVGEITRTTIFLPPGTTAVGCDQFGAPIIVTVSTGETVTMNTSDNSTFVGFVSNQPIQTITFELDFPEPTPDVLIDNFSFGQRREGNDPPTPMLIVPNNTGRAGVLDSVTKVSEPFQVVSKHNLSEDEHTRITLFIVGLTLESADAPFVKVLVENSQQKVVELSSEATARVKNFSWISQVTVRLPDELAGVGEVNVSVSVRGKVSNKAALRIN